MSIAISLPLHIYAVNTDQSCNVLLTARAQSGSDLFTQSSRATGMAEFPNLIYLFAEVINQKEAGCNFPSRDMRGTCIFPTFRLKSKSIELHKLNKLHLSPPGCKRFAELFLV